MKNQKGFTLIELLVVIGIISILASVVVVAMKDSKSMSDPLSEEEVCKRKGLMLSVTELPAACLKYYNGAQEIITGKKGN